MNKSEPDKKRTTVTSLRKRLRNMLPRVWADRQLGVVFFILPLTIILSCSDPPPPPTETVRSIRTITVTVPASGRVIPLKWHSSNSSISTKLTQVRWMVKARAVEEEEEAAEVAVEKRRPQQQPARQPLQPQPKKKNKLRE